MQFTKTNNIYKIIRITGSQDNILGIVFDEKNNNNETNSIEVIAWEFPNIKRRITLTSKEEVLKQVSAGLKLKNEAFKTDYKLSKIYFSPFDSPADSIYSTLTCLLIRHYHTGGEFKEV